MEAGKREGLQHRTARQGQRSSGWLNKGRQGGREGRDTNVTQERHKGGAAIGISVPHEKRLQQPMAPAAGHMRPMPPRSQTDKRLDDFDTTQSGGTCRGSPPAGGPVGVPPTIAPTAAPTTTQSCARGRSWASRPRVFYTLQAEVNFVTRSRLFSICTGQDGH